VGMMGESNDLNEENEFVAKKVAGIKSPSVNVRAFKVAFSGIS
jgi:hypothetical protein